ncbi:restriction endonuclease [Streptomyces sp. NPDC048291]|uniref:restriction endonuclease n=1 Tax=Streptomyces sp. NPDC048291 TaxID=3365530 RepID=UPI003715ACBF
MSSVMGAYESVADRAFQILNKHHRGLMPLDDLAKELLVAAEDTATAVPTPVEELAQELLQDDARRTAMGYRQRFMIAGGSVRLRAEGNKAELGVERWNSQVKADLLLQLKGVHPRTFELIVAKLLAAMGYEEVRVTQYSNDGGIDIEAVFTAGGIARTPIAVQVKRYDKQKTVQRPDVQKLRGAAVRHPVGMIVTTAKFSPRARVEAARAEEKPIYLIDGESLVDLMTQHNVGINSSPLVLLSVDEQGLASPESDAVEELAATADEVRSASADYILEKLPGGRSADYFETVVAMARLALGQPPLFEYVAAFQHRFPSIGRADVARRRMRILLSLGLAEIESDRVVLTPLGEEVIKASDPRLLSTAFLSRIAGAEEIRNLARGTSDLSELRRELGENPPTGLSTTQALRVLRWLLQLRLL